MRSVNPACCSTLTTEPCTWALVEGLFAPDHLAGLARDFPGDGFCAVASGAPGTPLVHHRTLLPRGPLVGSAGAEAPEAWLEFLHLLRGRAYQDFIQGWSGHPLGGCAWEVTWWRYDPGAWLVPRRGRLDQLVTHVITLNPQWQAPWGGARRILGSGDPADVRAEVPPTLAHSLVLVGSPSSWHALAPVATGAPPLQALQVVLWAKS